MDKYDDPNFVFTYDETSPSCLRWKNVKRKSNSSVGQPAGSFNNSGGRWYVTFRGKPCGVHRVIYQMHCEDFDNRDTVHFKDGNSDNLRLGNLELCRYEDKVVMTNAILKGDLKECFDYDDGNLYWKRDKWSGHTLRQQDAKKGDPISTDYNHKGYLLSAGTIKLGGVEKRHFIHRLIYEWHYGKMPCDMQIDHINGIKTDNRIENLRLVTSATNSRNLPRSSRNTTGVTGVSTNRNCSYVATWMVNGKNVCKYFSWDKYGKEKAFELACKARKDAIRKLNEEYGEEGYTEDHGERVLD